MYNEEDARNNGRRCAGIYLAASAGLLVYDSTEDVTYCDRVLESLKNDIGQKNIDLHMVKDTFGLDFSPEEFNREIYKDKSLKVMKNIIENFSLLPEILGINLNAKFGIAHITSRAN